jgi:hypothetical protein
MVILSEREEGRQQFSVPEVVESDLTVCVIGSVIGFAVAVIGFAVIGFVVAVVEMGID